MVLVIPSLMHYMLTNILSVIRTLYFPAVRAAGTLDAVTYHLSMTEQTMSYDVCSPNITRATLINRLVEWQLFFLTGEEHYGRLQADDGTGVMDPHDLCELAQQTGDVDLWELAVSVERLADGWERAYDAIETARGASLG